MIQTFTEKRKEITKTTRCTYKTVTWKIDRISTPFMLIFIFIFYLFQLIVLFCAGCRCRRQEVFSCSWCRSLSTVGARLMVSAVRSAIPPAVPLHPAALPATRSSVSVSAITRPTFHSSPTLNLTLTSPAPSATWRRPSSTPVLWRRYWRHQLRQRQSLSLTFLPNFSSISPGPWVCGFTAFFLSGMLCILMFLCFT